MAIANGFMEVNSSVNMNMSSTKTQVNTTPVETNSKNPKIDTDNNNNGQIKTKMRHEQYVPTIAEKTILNTIEEANKKLFGSQKEIRMTVHEETKRISTKIVDKETNEVIAEYPPEKLLDIFAKMIELSGLIVDEKR